MLPLFLLEITDEKDKLKAEKIYDAYNALVYNEAFGILQDRYDAEDASQNAWKSIIRNINSIDTSNEFKLTAYLLMIARNAAFSILRQKRKNKTIDIDSLPDSLFLIDNGIEEGLESKEAYQKIVNFIKSLPEIYVTVLTMHFLLNLTTQEIASSLNIKPSTAKQRLTRGKKLLQLLLQEENN